MSIKARKLCCSCVKLWFGRIWSVMYHSGHHFEEGAEDIHQEAAWIISDWFRECLEYAKESGGSRYHSNF